MASSTTADATASSSSSGTPWVERYRPQSLKDVSHQTEVVSTLQNATATGRLPHLLFYGPPGTGKTSVALALCHQLWHPDQWRRRVLELNASDERGISVVRNKIKHFASLSVGKSTSTNKSFFPKNDDDTEVEEEKQYPNPPFKIIILDEADTVTPDAQAALRRIIEAHSRITRFILICNYVTRIIEPLASRCAKFRFQPLPPASMKARLESIATAENCNLGDTELDEILSVSKGDMRRAVTTLQSLHVVASGSDTSVTRNDIAEFAGLPPPSQVEGLWKALQSNSFQTMEQAVEEVCANGFAAKSILVALLDLVIGSSSSDLVELAKAQAAIRIAEAEKNLVDGADEYLQLMTVCSFIMTCMAQSSLSKD